LNIKNSRNLIYVPVIHTQADMGSMSVSLKQEYVKKFGKGKWQQHVREIDQMWEGLRDKIKRLNLDWSRVRVYQDGLPVCGKEKEIIKDLAAQGSKNHEIVAWLLESGAKIEGTEDAPLLLREYSYIKKLGEAHTKEAQEKATQEYEDAAAKLLKNRDTFIKNRIDKTLNKGETGILFMGLLHKVDEGLADDINVSYLIYRLPFKRRAEITQIS